MHGCPINAVDPIDPVTYTIGLTLSPNESLIQPLAPVDYLLSLSGMIFPFRDCFNTDALCTPPIVLCTELWKRTTVDVPRYMPNREKREVRRGDGRLVR